MCSRLLSDVIQRTGNAQPGYRADHDNSRRTDSRVFHRLREVPERCTQMPLIGAGSTFYRGARGLGIEPGIDQCVCNIGKPPHAHVHDERHLRRNERAPVGLERANGEIAELHVRISFQREIVKQLAAAGADTTLAQRVLEIRRERLARALDHQRFIVSQIGSRIDQYFCPGSMN